MSHQYDRVSRLTNVISAPNCGSQIWSERIG
jgi:hypothetical protein